MAGKYPKEFKFFGWHPNCRCTTIPILAKDIDNVLESEKITELPKPMRDWLNDNADKIEKAKSKPWFVVENGGFIEKSNLKTVLREQRTEIKKWAKENLIGKTITHAGVDGEIYFTTTGIKEALNQPHKYILEKNEAIKDIINLIKNAEYIRTDKDSKGRNIIYYYLETIIKKEISFIIIKKEANRNSFYSITDNLKKKND